MAIDKPALKAAAEAANREPWHYTDVRTVSPPDESDPYIVGDVNLDENGYYIALANPATILELLAEIEALSAAREGAPGRLAHVLDDTRGFHVESLDDDIRDEFMHRLARAAFEVTLPTSWHPVKPQKGGK